MIMKIFINIFITMNEDKEHQFMMELEPVSVVQAFANPICKQTFDSLPKIYGKKKRKPIILSSPSKTNHKHHFFSSSKSLSKQKGKPRSSSTKLTEPRNSTCLRKNCFGNLPDLKKIYPQKKNKLKHSDRWRSKLPELRSFDLSDLQTQYKVRMNGNYPTGIGLQKIIEENGTNEPDNNKKQVSKLKMQTRFRPKFKIDEEEESGEDSSSGQRNKNKRNSEKFKTQINQTQSPKSTPSFSLSSYILNGLRKSNTQFHDLAKHEKGFKLKKQSSQLSNGLFRIPQQPQYQEYLKDYESMNPQFKMMEIVKRPNFHIVREEKGVYFGETNSNKAKHGEGVTVTEKEIFQGKYNKNVKIQGYQRNIDGVYTGDFVNGIRNGFGVFTWNNGQVYEGQWKNGMKEGRGIWKSPKGDWCEGQWKRNRQSGKGYFKHKISTYDGQFLNSLKHGYGEELFSNGDSYVGKYKHGKPEGKGRYEWKDGGYYEGEFLRGMREGKGVWVDSNGTTYEGTYRCQFKEDFKHGKGTETYKSGEKFEGEFDRGEKVSGKIIKGAKVNININ